MQDGTFRRRTGSKPPRRLRRAHPSHEGLEAPALASRTCRLAPFLAFYGRLRGGPRILVPSGQLCSALGEFPSFALALGVGGWRGSSEFWGSGHLPGRAAEGLFPVSEEGSHT